MSMHAFAVDEFGGRGSIHELALPDPDSGEILVTVRAAGVNVMDPYYVVGAVKDYMEHRFPLVPGIDFAGGVGSFVTQMAAARGATVVAVTTAAGDAQARQQGAADTIDHQASDVPKVLRDRYPAGIDTLISMYGDVETVAAIAATLREGGL